MHKPRKYFRRVLPFLLLLLIAAALRTVHLEGRLLEVDEAFSIRLANLELNSLIERTSLDVHPPAFYLILKLWVALFGNSLTVIRALGVFLSLLTIPACVFLFNELKKHDIETARSEAGYPAVFAASLPAFHLLHVSAGQVARMYSLGILATSLSGLFLLRWIRREKKLDAVGFVFFSCLLLYTHNFGLFTVCAYFAYFLWTAMDRRRRGQLAISSCVRSVSIFFVIALIYSPWIRVILFQTQDVSTNYWIPDLTLELGMNAFFLWLSGLPDFGVSFWLTDESWFSFVISVTILALLISTFPNRVSNPVVFALTTSIVPWLGCLLHYWVFGQSILLVRCLSFANVGLILASAVFYSSSDSKLVQRAWIAFIGLLVINSFFLQSPNLRNDSDDSIIAAMQYLKVEAREGDVIEVANPAEVLRIGYYLERYDVDVPLFCRFKHGDGHDTHVAALSQSEIDVPAQDGIQTRWRIGFEQVFRTESDTEAYLLAREFPGNGGAAFFVRKQLNEGLTNLKNSSNNSLSFKRTACPFDTCEVIR